ncbi:META domain-containing protein [Corynebacterium glucuronolyticum]|uniref:META domain-containing protein n=1 Tax=Corynebacterium glucuronolyticum TaxID=39791 RepID=UPI00191F9853|nr:META domain-containing protein [Corynebacterium glucuronolyticum]QQU88756.1 META domain-containing protein [Corynebacterium glucuronolyticum]
MAITLFPIAKSISAAAVAFATALSSNMGVPMAENMSSDAISQVAEATPSTPAALTASTVKTTVPTNDEAQKLLTGHWRAASFPDEVTLDFYGHNKLTYQGDCNPVSQADSTLEPAGTLAVSGGGATLMACSPRDNELGAALRSVLLAHPQVLKGADGQLVLKSGDKQIEFIR